MRNRIRLILIALAVVIFAGSFLVESSAQKRKGDFSHNSSAHKKLDCSSCHKNPTPNWATARGYPDVADFPGHAACFACHKSEFFAGNKPAICVGCHVNPGPRGVARFPFPVSSRPHEFSSVFPHSVHQDVVAADNSKRDVAIAHFIFTSFIRTTDDMPQFNNCAICHQTRKELPKFTARIPASMQPLGEAATDNFTPASSFFKDTPDSHASCFTCHFQGVKPAGTNCAGCHQLTAPYAASTTVKRYSLKFDHQQKEHSIRDCMTCHVRIAENADLKTLVDADVPFMACVSCHADKLAQETGKRAESVANKQPAFQCTYCHTSAVGRFPVPPSHQDR